MSVCGVIVALCFIILWSCAQDTGPSNCYSCHGTCEDPPEVRKCRKPEPSENVTNFCLTRNLILAHDEGIRDDRSCMRTDSPYIHFCINTTDTRCILCDTDLCNSKPLYNYTKKNSTPKNSYPDTILFIVLCILFVFTTILK